MTRPSFQSLMVVMCGWVFARRRTVTNIIVAAGAVGRKHHSAFHRLFAAARWSLDEVGLQIFDLIVPWLGEDRVVMLAVDDTLARKRGLQVFGVGMHHDPMISTRKTALTNWGHSWVIVSVIVRFPFCAKRCFGLPILCRLYLNTAAAGRHRRVYRTRPELAIEMLRLLCTRHESRRFHAVADMAYGGQSVLNQRPSNCDLTSRLLLDARVYEAAPSRRAGAPGRPRVRGARRPSPRAMLQQRADRRTFDIYGRSDRVRVADTVAYIHAAPRTPLRIVAVEPLTGGRTSQAFYSTCAEASAEQVIQWYAMRWSLEVTIHDAKSTLGFEEPQGWTRRAVERTAPMAMLLYTLIVLWFAAEGHRAYHAPNRPWYRHKPHASFADMLGTLRRESVRQQFPAPALRSQATRKLFDALTMTLQQAA